MPVSVDPGDPRHWGVAQVDEAAVRVDLSLWDEAVLRMRDREQTRAVILEAYGLPEEVVAPLLEYDELIASTRAEFPYDQWGYGRIPPVGPMRWTPPADGGEVPSCPA